MFQLLITVPGVYYIYILVYDAFSHRGDKCCLHCCLYHGRNIVR